MAADEPQMAANDYPELKPASYSIIGAAIAVHNKLGFGFAEKVYENSLAIELRRRGLEVQQQRPVHVRYDEDIVGDYVTDLLIDGRIIVEVKAVIGLNAEHRAQCINYLRATGLNLCMLLNFGRRRLEYQRIAFTHSSANICGPFAAICVP